VLVAAAVAGVDDKSDAMVGDGGTDDEAHQCSDRLQCRDS